MATLTDARQQAQRARRSALISRIQRARAKVIAQAEAIRELGGDPVVLLESIEQMAAAENDLFAHDQAAAA